MPPLPIFSGLSFERSDKTSPQVRSTEEFTMPEDVALPAQRACFTLQVHGEHIAEYVRRHSPVRSAMLLALRDAGWNNYSIFLRPDGLVVGYFETDDLQLALGRIEAMEANARWQEDSAPLFEAGRLVWLPQVFNLEEQLSGL